MDKKVLYNITVVIDQEAHDEWKSWMINHHIPDVMSTGCFTEYKMSLILNGEGNQSINYAIQYVAPSMDVFQQYRNLHAQRLIGEHQSKFKDRYASFRTLMEIHDEG